MANDTAPKVMKLPSQLKKNLDAMKCDTEVRSYKAKVAIALCSEVKKTGCFTQFTCGKSVTIPSEEYEFTEVESGTSCDLSGETIWKEYEVDPTSSLSEYSQEVDYTPALYDKAKSFGKQKVVVIIETTDSRKTQFGFFGFLKVSDLTFAGRNSSDITMFNLTVQPTGAPFLMHGEYIPLCEDGK